MITINATELRITSEWKLSNGPRGRVWDERSEVEIMTAELDRMTQAPFSATVIAGPNRIEVEVSSVQIQEDSDGGTVHSLTGTMTWPMAWRAVKPPGAG